ncbi:MAG: GYD domain-containing protein [Dehalococcoidia bacterium]|nr:GYD domain-containing protein [Dehalococcoidia bacterium]
MATYVALLKFTDSGVKNVREAPKDLDNARQAFEAAGGGIQQYYLTLGEYDAVAVITAPDDEAYTRTMLMIASRGHLSSVTLKTLSESQFRSVISGLP